MSSQILFRSLKSGRDTTWVSHTYVRQRGSSWSHIRPYIATDDIRDIAWGKIKPEGLSVRERENNGEFEIISFWWDTPYDEFYIENPEFSKKVAIHKAKDTISFSAHIWQYNYHEYSGNDKIRELIRSQPRNSLIFICNIDITDDIRMLAYHNDLIYLDIFHPFESNPNTNILFSWQILNIIDYKKAYSEYIESQKNIIKKMKGNHISFSTTDNISSILNLFFKKRYKNG